MDIVPFLSSPIATAIMLIGSIVGIVWASIVFIRWITRRKRKNELLEKILDKIEQLPSNFPLNYTKDDMKRSKLDELIEYNEFLYKLLKNRYYEAVTEFEETRKLQPSRKTAGYIDESLEITSRFIEETVNEVLSLSEGKGFYLSETYLERVPIDLLSQFIEGLKSIEKEYFEDAEMFLREAIPSEGYFGYSMGVYLALAYLKSDAGDFNESLKLFETALYFAEKLNNTPAILIIHFQRGILAGKIGLNDILSDSAKSGYKLAIEIGDNDAIAHFANMLGGYYSKKLLLSESYSYLYESLKLFKQLANIKYKLIVLFNIGGNKCIEGYYNHSIRILKYVYSESKKNGDEVMAGTSCVSIASAIRDSSLGDNRKLEDALPYALEAIELLKDTKYIADAVLARCIVGEVLALNGDIDGAIGIYDEAIRTTFDYSLLFLRSELYMAKGQAYVKIKEDIKAASYFENALQIAKSLDDVRLIAKMDLCYAGLYITKGNFALALDYLYSYRSYLKEFGLLNPLKKIDEEIEKVKREISR